MFMDSPHLQPLSQLWERGEENIVGWVEERNPTLAGEEEKTENVN